MIEAEGADARIIVANFAAAGLIKSYVRFLKTENAGAVRETRDCRLPHDIWEQIIAQGKVNDAFSIGSVRLSEADHRNVTAIGIRFDERSIATIARDHGLTPSRAAEPPSAVAKRRPFVSKKPTSSSPKADKIGPKPHCAVPGRALQLTINEAMAALAVGRTTLYRLISEGALVMQKTRGRSHVTMESLRAFMNR